jgi:hypothetical protein
VRSGVQSTKAAVSSGKGLVPPLFVLSVGTHSSSSRGSTLPDDGYITPAGKITTKGRALMLDEGREGSPCDASPEIVVGAFDDAIPGPVAVPNV